MSLTALGGFIPERRGSAPSPLGTNTSRLSLITPQLKTENCTIASHPHHDHVAVAHSAQISQRLVDAHHAMAQHAIGRHRAFNGPAHLIGYD
jgi:hypothetical protein